MFLKIFSFLLFFVLLFFGQTNKESQKKITIPENINNINDTKSIPKVRVRFVEKKQDQGRLNKITMGEYFYFILEVKAEENYRVIPPNLKGELEELEITDYEVQKNKSKQLFFYQLISYQVGKLMIPSMKVELMDGENKLILKTRSISIEISSVLSESEKVNNEIKGIRNIINFNLLSEWFWYILFLIVIFIIIISVFIFLLIKHLKKEKPYYVIILRELKLIANKDWFKNNDYKKYYYLFSNLVVEYLVNEKVVLASMSSKEMISNIKKKNYFDKSFYNSFLKDAEGIKFANQIPDKEKTKKYLSNFQQILNKKIIEEKSNKLKKNKK